MATKHHITRAAAKVAMEPDAKVAIDSAVSSTTLNKIKAIATEAAKGGVETDKAINKMCVDARNELVALFKGTIRVISLLKFRY